MVDDARGFADLVDAIQSCAGREIATGDEPDRLLSPFINGIKRMRCQFTPTTVSVDDCSLA